MKRIYLLWMLLLVCNLSFAQLSRNKEALKEYYIKQSEACGGVAALFKKKGSWKRDTFGDGGVFSDKTFSADKHVEILNRLEKILPVLKEALPDLGGFELGWYRSITGNSMVANGPVPALFTGSVFTYFCNNADKILLGEEASSSLKIYFNSYGLFGEKLNQWDINNDGKMVSIYQLPDSIGKWKGLTLYEPKQTGGPGLPTDRAVVLGHNRQMPWHILTQKQYLTGYANELLKNKKEQVEGNDTYIQKMKENIASMRASKAFTPEQKKSTVEKLEEQLKEFSDNTSKKNIAEAGNIYKEKIKPVNEYLDTASAETLTQRAILDKNSIEFKGYFAKPGQSGIKLISFTSKYFNPALPRYVPQFIVLYWRWGQDPPSLKFAKEMDKNFPVEKLKTLIDK
ncbi:MAG: hypothetical protein H7Y86_05560 [Rhizobacter sp.]|nr:hypothetical protein [Ferruginibacter sp.]